MSGHDHEHQHDTDPAGAEYWNERYRRSAAHMERESQPAAGRRGSRPGAPATRSMWGAARGPTRSGWPSGAGMWWRPISPVWPSGAQSGGLLGSPIRQHRRVSNGDRSTFSATLLSPTASISSRLSSCSCRPEPHTRLFNALAASVRSGGALLVVGHHPSDVVSGVHRPPDPERFYTGDDIAGLLDCLWTIVVNEVRPRSVSTLEGDGSISHDAVLLAVRE